MLGLGRAMGETIAATIVIGNAPVIGNSLFDQGYTLAAVIANEFGEAASDPLHRAALIAAGLVLFVLTLIVNAIARGGDRHGPGAGARRPRARPSERPDDDASRRSPAAPPARRTASPACCSPPAPCSR